MEWATHDHRPRPRPDPPAPLLIERCWLVIMAPQGRLLSCGLYSDRFNRIEVRLEYGQDDLLASRVVKDVEFGRVVARDWLEAIREIGDGFSIPT